MKCTLLLLTLAALTVPSTWARPGPGIFEGFLNGIANIFGSEVTTPISDFAAAVKTSTEESVRNAQRYGQMIANAENHLLVSAVANFASTVQAINKNIPNVINGVRNSIKRQALSQIPVILQLVPAAANALKTLLTDFSQKATEKIGTQGKEIFENWNTWMENQVDQVSNTVNHDPVTVALVRRKLEDVLFKYSLKLGTNGDHLLEQINEVTVDAQKLIASYQSTAEQLIAAVQACLDSDDGDSSCMRCKNNIAAILKTAKDASRSLDNLQAQGLQLIASGLYGKISTEQILRQFESEKGKIVRELDDIIKINSRSKQDDGTGEAYNANGVEKDNEDASDNAKDYDEDGLNAGNVNKDGEKKEDENDHLTKSVEDGKKGSLKDVVVGSKDTKNNGHNDDKNNCNNDSNNKDKTKETAKYEKNNAKDSQNPDQNIFIGIWQGFSNLSQNIDAIIRNTPQSATNIVDGVVNVINIADFISAAQKFGVLITKELHDLLSQGLEKFSATLRNLANYLNDQISDIGNEIVRQTLQSILTRLQRVQRALNGLVSIIASLQTNAVERVPNQLQKIIAGWKDWADSQIALIGSASNGNTGQVAFAERIIDQALELFTNNLSLCADEVTLHLTEYENDVQRCIAKYQLNAENIGNEVKACVESSDQSTQQCRISTIEEWTTLKNAPRALKNLREQGRALIKRDLHANACVEQTSQQFEQEKAIIARKLTEFN